MKNQEIARLFSDARRGWLEKGDVLNTLELAQLRKRLGLKRKKYNNSFRG